MKFELDLGCPRPSHDEYRRYLHSEFHILLDQRASEEHAFQDFFARNPHMVPGSKSEMDFGPSGHGPVRMALIDRPRIQGIVARQPDFVWLSYDSQNFTPVFIEIEAPSKRYFTKRGHITADFAAAKNQLDEWGVLLSKPENRLLFYETFAIDLRLRKSIFKPRFLLIYGRRSEYMDDPMLKDKRAFLVDQGSRQYLMSYDRLNPTAFENNFITCKVIGGKFQTLHLPSTFHLGPYEDHLTEVEDLVNAVDGMALVSQERKDFLRRRIPYWISFMGKRKQRTVDILSFKEPHRE